MLRAACAIGAGACFAPARTDALTSLTVDRINRLEHKLASLERSVKRNGSNTTTVIGFGSLLSEVSARGTMPNLQNFRLGTVQGYRRLFTHPAAIFFERGIADLESKEISSLSSEKCDGCSFTVALFEINNDELPPLIEREEEFDMVMVPIDDGGFPSTGLMCTRSSDETYIARWGYPQYRDKTYGFDLPSIWGWDENSGILPCRVYLRHCVLAASKQGPVVLDSFLDGTYLADRKTTIREYLDANPEVMSTMPPSHLIGRYSG
jgi:hypothetical protein